MFPKTHCRLSDSSLLSLLHSYNSPLSSHIRKTYPAVGHLPPLSVLLGAENVFYKLSWTFLMPAYSILQPLK